MVTVDGLYAQMQAALLAAGADVARPPTGKCPECGAQLPDCNCVVMAVIAPEAYTSGDTTAYDGKPVPDMVRRDDEGWRRL